MRFLTVLIDAFRNLHYRYRMWRLGVNEQYIRDAFNYLAELDMPEFVEAKDHGFEFRGEGNQLHIRTFEYVPAGPGMVKRSGGYWSQYVIKEGLERRIYVDEWRPETRTVILDFGSKHETHWWEVYRSGKWVRSVEFVKYLKILYGEGPNAVQKQCAKGSDIREVQEEAGGITDATRNNGHDAGRASTNANGDSKAGSELQPADKLPG